MACGFATGAYAYTREQFAAVSADEYAVYADVNAKYDDGSDKLDVFICQLYKNKLQRISTRRNMHMV
ncbi:MAG: hypothetical protein J6Y90_05150, partial [Lachnospiraceae bacterium]|nr:hypothetical protein [Lachnospiraceae bacterium]